MKKFYNEHRVFIILMGIVVICFIAIMFLLLKYFYFGNPNSTPKRTCADISGSRQGDITGTLEKEAIVSNAKIRISDKSNIIFISIIFNSDASLLASQSVAAVSLEEFTEEERACYDIEFVISAPATSSSGGFHLMGARNANGTNIHWNNNREIEENPE